MVVHKKIAKRTCKVFYELYRIKYPIAGMQLVDEYDADDEASMAANNTSSFNYRKVANSSKMSKHSQGLAIDINQGSILILRSMALRRQTVKCTGTEMWRHAEENTGII